MGCALFLCCAGLASRPSELPLLVPRVKAGDPGLWAGATDAPVGLQQWVQGLPESRAEDHPPPLEGTLESNGMGCLLGLLSGRCRLTHLVALPVSMRRSPHFSDPSLSWWPCPQVKSVRRRDKKASVLFIEGDMNPKGRG